MQYKTIQKSEIEALIQAENNFNTIDYSFQGGYKMLDNIEPDIYELSRMIFEYAYFAIENMYYDKSIFAIDDSFFHEFFDNLFDVIPVYKTGQFNHFVANQMVIDFITEVQNEALTMFDNDIDFFV